MTGSIATDRLEPRIPAPLADRYAIGSILGRGGKAMVFLAQDGMLDRRVAIKVFRARAETAEALREQEAEAKLIASLNHYALTTLFDAGVDTSDPAHPQIYLVMEYIEGSDLRERLRQGPLGWLQACWLGRDLAEGLDYVHRAGFLHRDIKPENVLIAARDAGTRLRGKLTDFGISSFIGSPQPGEYVTGTAAYLSPEQVEGHDADLASDVYSLGLVLLETITGTVAYPGGVEESAFGRLDHDPAIPASVPRPVAAALRAMTARDPADRPTPAAVAAMFQDLLIDELVRQRGAKAAASDEELRLAAVERYDVLETPDDEAFDRVTRLVARVLRAPIAMVSIVDRDRVWFKSKQGIADHGAPRSTALCHVEGASIRPWSIADAGADARTRAHPMVTDGRVRSIAAAPLVSSDRHAIGSLCVLDPRVRRFSDDELATLADLADMLMRELELRLAGRRALFDR